MYRAKFRVLRKIESTTEVRRDGRWDRDPVVVVEFHPVNTKNQWDPNGSEENAAFWEATPSGEASLTMSPEAAEAYPIGQAFYVDFERNDAGSWKRGCVVLFDGAVEISLHPVEGPGKVKMNVQRVGTVLSLLDDVFAPMREALVSLREKGETNGYHAPGTRWSVKFSPTDG